MKSRVVKSGICGLAWLCALVLTIEWTHAHPRHLLALVALFLAVKICTSGLLGSFDELWTHTSLEDLVMLAVGVLASSLVLAIVLALLPILGSPALALVDGALTLAFLSAVRVAPRVYCELVRPRLQARAPRAVVLAGRAELVDLELRRLRRQPSAKARVAGLVLDGPPLDGARMHRLRILGRPELQQLIARRRVDEVTVVPPTTPGFASGLEQLCAVYRVPFRPAASLLALSELLRSADQLLDRPSAPASRSDDPAITRFVEGRCVLVTGAGGSIGRELALQLLLRRPSKLILVNRGENALFHAERALEAANVSGCQIESHVLDVRTEEAVQRLFARHRPELVFHAAAHKHVPMMERHPCEAVLNNIGGVRVVAEAAHGYAADAFVFVSTDKAVRPTSIMGATKRLGELYVCALAARSTTRFVSVRFGNVLGSNGSVLPIFIEQVQRGGPVTVTHADMMRYFMSIPEACRLVLRAAMTGEGGELFVLDMGQPTRIVDLAARVIERAGLRPGEDVPIVFSGTRPGEKLSEELMTNRERQGARHCDGIWTVEVEAAPLEHLAAECHDLLELARTGDDLAVRQRLVQLLPEYQADDPDTEETEETEEAEETKTTEDSVRRATPAAIAAD
jgi:FlaA1/EpsC-like NDP-sugar epimerase